MKGIFDHIKWKVGLWLIKESDQKYHNLLAYMQEKEQEISQSNERLALVLRAPNEAIGDWDIVNDKTIWGNGFQDIFGYNLKEYDKDLWSKNIHPEDRERVISDLYIALSDRSKDFFYAEFRFLRANREIAFVQQRSVILRDKNKRAVRMVGSLCDVTEAKKYVMEIQSQNKKLKEIAWVQSHLVRGPLSRMMTLLNFMKDEEDVKLNEGECIDLLFNSTNELDQMIRNIVKETEKIEHS